MRSHGSPADQEPLPFDVLPRVAPPQGPRRLRVVADRPGVVRLGDELALVRGWPAGTEVNVDPARRPVRGDVLVVREQGALTAGVFDRHFGRPVLRNDRGFSWIGLGAEVVGVVTLVSVPLDEMPGHRLSSVTGWGRR